MKFPLTIFAPLYFAFPVLAQMSNVQADGTFPQPLITTQSNQVAYTPAAFFSPSNSGRSTLVTIYATDSKCIASSSNSNWNDNRFRAYWSSASQGFVDGFVKFDLSSLPSGANITAMTLRTYHEYGFGNPHANPEVRVYRVDDDSWKRGATNNHPGMNEVLTQTHVGPFPVLDLIPYDWALDVNAANWAVDISDGTLSIGMRNELGGSGIYSYVYWYGSDASPAPPELIVEYGSGPTLSVNPLTAGQTSVVSLDNCTPNDMAYFVYSLAGGGPISTPFGPGYVSAPYTVMPLPTDANGHAGISKSVPAGTTGMNVWFHGADRGSATMLNPLAMIIQ